VCCDRLQDCRTFVAYRKCHRRAERHAADAETAAHILRRFPIAVPGHAEPRLFSGMRQGGKTVAFGRVTDLDATGPRESRISLEIKWRNRVVPRGELCKPNHGCRKSRQPCRVRRLRRGRVFPRRSAAHGVDSAFLGADGAPNVSADRLALRSHLRRIWPRRRYLHHCCPRSVPGACAVDQGAKKFSADLASS